jgi:hypothetical protein
MAQLSGRDFYPNFAFAGFAVIAQKAIFSAGS